MSTLHDLAHELWRRDRLLASAGWLHVGLLAVMVVVAPFDSRSVAGLNPWIKPMKFAISIAIYLWTAGWLLHYARRGPVRLVVRVGVVVAMVTEMACIALQAARGTTSHYNVATPFDAAVFNAMGLFIVVNTILVLVALWQFREPAEDLPPAYLWGIRLGLLLFAFAGLEGFMMTARGAHTVGLPDGGPGLPFVNWSTRAGDLRVAHFLGLHSLQILPLAGYLLSRGGWPIARQLTALGTGAAAYLAVVLTLLWQALGGRPLVSL